MKYLLQTGIAPSMLEVEITESTAIVNPEWTEGVLNSLREQGISLALDDFGCGYSSFGHLRRFPFSTLKIDRQFITGIQKSDDDLSIVEAMISLGHSLGLRTLAEGIETHGQLERLLRLGCDLGQGFLFCKAMPPEDIAELLKHPAPFRGAVQQQAPAVAGTR
jgi:EAL domain-containing protein (putative c-di-GMP-specific phosphodiesterase class I)